MGVSLKALVEELEALMPRFEARRNEDALANDCFEAAWYWRDLGRWVLEENTRVNYPARAKGEFLLLAQLRDLLARRLPQEQDEFSRALDAGEELLKIVAAVPLPADGHLGFLRIAREQFSFLKELGFNVVNEDPAEIRFSSGTICLELSHAVNPWLSCSFGPEQPDHPPSYWIQDLLYMYGDERYKALPERLDLNTAVCSNNSEPRKRSAMPSTRRRWSRSAAEKHPDCVNLLAMLSASLLNALRFRISHLTLRLAIAALVVVLLLCCGLRIYALHMAHRAFSLLDEASRIRVGLTEDSLLPLVARYGGVKRVPERPTAVDDCPDTADCAYQKAHLPDYSYEFELSPFHIFELKGQFKGFHRVVAFLMARTPSLWRGPFSLRAWLVYVTIPIKAGRIERVGSGLYVEGRTRWLANTWSLSADMPPEWQARTYAIDGFTLTMTYGGAGNHHYLTPAASAQQFQAAQSFNTRCVTGIIPCRCLANLSPLAFQYLSRHPDAGSSIETGGCPYRLNPH